ncbi:MAG: NAD(P)-dependent oxidoreductase [Rhodospirillales bacterium]|nr:NAD(P)-dependent oxidoreductase [Rhodospirillales bacterium]MDE2199981.1 NAD(P)-dependent oxidoreductase [Rhodospirillales bacterium]MDE2576826.1 NAD(P)-dependent oxidoreductase [Rhodospirillales bacterium]
MAAVGFVGLGAMGLPMAQALLARGFVVRGHDLRTASTAALVEAGGIAAGSAAAAATGADALVLMVVDAAQAEAVLFDEGALEALPPHGLVVLTATCPPAAVTAIAGRVSASGRRFIDAPVSGGVAGARAARLTIMAAGPSADIAAVRPLLAAFGERIFHVGERPGQGAVMKSVNQLLCGAHLAVAAEGLALATRLGVDGRIALEIMGGSAAASWMLNDRGPRMLEATPEVTSAIDIFVKDLGIVMQAGRDSRAALPIAAIAHQLFLSVSGRGEGGADDSQVIRAYRALNGP